MRLDPSLPQADQLLYSTLIAGDGYEGIKDFDVTSSGTVIGVGFTGSNTLTTNGLPVTCGND